MAWTILLRKLAARDRTRAELSAALTDRDVPAEVAERALRRAAALGIIDDAAFAHRWVDSRQRGRPRSRAALRYELGVKGVEPQLATEAIEAISDEAELAAARRIVAQRGPSVSGLPPDLRRRRLAGALSRRGFTSGMVARALREYEAELAEGGAAEAAHSGSE